MKPVAVGLAVAACNILALRLSQSLKAKAPPTPVTKARPPETKLAAPPVRERKDANARLAALARHGLRPPSRRVGE
jgi:hypothetical protein